MADAAAQQQQQQQQQRNGGAAAAGANRRNNGNNAGAPDPLINVRDRLFHTLFYRLTLAYARACPRPVRRLLETMVLLKALLCFFMLIYVHVAFSRRPVHCLEHVKDAWPRDGILRQEIFFCLRNNGLFIICSNILSIDRLTFREVEKVLGPAILQ